MFSHKDDRELFHDVIVNFSGWMDIAIEIVEKDYYVTIILNELLKHSDKVFSKDEITISKIYNATNKCNQQSIGTDDRKNIYLIVV